jgi:hypothetical protein
MTNSGVIAKTVRKETAAAIRPPTLLPYSRAAPFKTANTVLKRPGRDLVILIQDIGAYTANP